MWTARIFFTIVFSGIGFMLWFLSGLVREELVSAPQPAPNSAPARRPEKLRLMNLGSTIQQEQDFATIRLVSRFGADAAR